MSDIGIYCLMVLMLCIITFKSVYDHLTEIRNWYYDCDDIDHEFTTTEIKI